MFQFPCHQDQVQQVALFHVNIYLAFSLSCACDAWHSWVYSFSSVQLRALHKACEQEWDLTQLFITVR